MQRFVQLCDHLITCLGLYLPSTYIYLVLCLTYPANSEVGNCDGILQFFNSYTGLTKMVMAQASCREYADYSEVNLVLFQYE